MITPEDIKRLKAEIKAEVLEEVRAEIFPSPDTDEVVRAIQRRDRKWLREYNRRKA